MILNSGNLYNSITESEGGDMKNFKKDLCFVIPMVIICVLLILLKVTGLTIHIILSVVGVGILVAYAVITRKEWKLPVLEIVMRVLYAIALISGMVIMNIHSVAALSVIHKVSAVLSLMTIIALFIHKAIKK